VLGVVDTDERRRVDLVGRDRHADAVRELHHPLLLEIRKPHVALDQIVLEHFRALQFHLELRNARDRDPHLVVHALPLHQVAGAVHPRARTYACLIRLALLDGFVGRVARTADRRDAEGEERAPLRLAEIRLEMRVEFGEPGHHRQIRRVDHLTGVIGVGVGHDRADPVPFDDDVDVRARRGALHVDQVAGVHYGSRRWHGWRVLQREWHGPRLTGFDVDDLQLVERLVEDVVRISGPAR